MALTLSIVVCSYNQRSFVRETLESVVNQQDLRPGELETIVIDGASTDGSAALASCSTDSGSWSVSGAGGRLPPVKSVTRSRAE